jgi:hypothetical protein
MKRVIACVLVLIFSLPAVAVDDSQVVYVGGTASGVRAGTIGRLDTTSDADLIFEHSGSKFAIPYAGIESCQYSRELARELGVLPTIAIGLFKTRQHRHFFRISYHNSNQTAQVVIFEVPKQMPRVLEPVLQARVPRTCNPYLPRVQSGIPSGDLPSLVPQSAVISPKRSQLPDSRRYVRGPMRLR